MQGGHLHFPVKVHIFKKDRTWSRSLSISKTSVRGEQGEKSVAFFFVTVADAVGNLKSYKYIYIQLYTRCILCGSNRCVRISLQ